MGLRFGLAKMIGATLTWGLRSVCHRPAANTPGKIALYADPALISDLAPRLRRGSVVVVGTNGKTTVTNLLADVVERSGQSVVCNRTGANLDSGVATALLQSKGADWGVFESDELWMAKILPHLQSNYVVLLNLFRDQLDRCGEIDRIQDSIVATLGKSPKTVLVYNADDPLCAMIAERAAALPGRGTTPSVPFGVAESMDLAQNAVADATVCQRCSSMFEYGFRQYGQLGEYRCPNCGFARPELEFSAEDVELGARGLKFAAVDRRASSDVAGDAGAAWSCDVRASFSGAYMVYNLLAVATAASLLGCAPDDVAEAIDAFDPKNGRLQDYEIEGHRVLLNLAKNPTGFNQNLRIVAQDAGPKAVAFFVNDKEGDGRDVSWIWDIDFEELASQRDCIVFVGGERRNDLQVRLKYAGVDARLIGGVDEVFAALSAGVGLPADAGVYAIANYTALPVVHAALNEAAKRAAAGEGGSREDAPASGDRVAASAPAAAAPTPTAVDGAASAPAPAIADEQDPPLVIAHMFPDLLNLYGDGGNVRALEQRCRWRGIPVEVRRVEHGQTIDLSEVDLVFLGGGPDREQKLASSQLMRMRDDIARFVEEDGALLAICGGYQILGKTWLLGEEEVEGLGVLDIETHRPGTSADRLIGNVVLDSTVASRPVVGYENHAGRTYLSAGMKALGSVRAGKGNNGEDGADGALHRNVVATYLHGPLLPKNPEVTDYLIRAALKRRSARTGVSACELAPLDDAVEIAANEYVVARFAPSAR